jgi:hypothetical protein
MADWIPPDPDQPRCAWRVNHGSIGPRNCFRYGREDRDGQLYCRKHAAMIDDIKEVLGDDALAPAGARAA